MWRQYKIWFTVDNDSEQEIRDTIAGGWSIANALKRVEISEENNIHMVKWNRLDRG